jgi:hypothetical protein
LCCIFYVENSSPFEPKKEISKKNNIPLFQLKIDCESQYGLDMILLPIHNYHLLLSNVYSLNQELNQDIMNHIHFVDELMMKLWGLLFGVTERVC